MFNIREYKEELEKRGLQETKATPNANEVKQAMEDGVEVEMTAKDWLDEMQQFTDWYVRKK